MPTDTNQSEVLFRVQQALKTGCSCGYPGDHNGDCNFAQAYEVARKEFVARKKA